MKAEIHPNYRDVVFVDLQTGNKFITRSTLNSRETIEMDGKTYPLFKCDVTSESHPFYTGAQTRIVETGRVEKFRARFARTSGTKKAPFFW
jgi:large subunit ribosomal protein L31